MTEASTAVAIREGRAITTQEGALALRQTTSSAAARCIDADVEQARSLLTPAVAELLPAALGEARARLAPALGADFKRTVAPTLTLVAGVGMSREDQRAWLATAAETLSGIPADLLEIGCNAARRTADHPAKIMPAIFATVQPLWDARKRTLAQVNALVALANSMPAEAETYISPEEASAIIAEHGLRASPVPSVVRHSGPPRDPTTAEIAEVAREIGINTTAQDSAPVADVSGLTIAQIFAQRDARRAGTASRDAA
jgi:hypothetical protein